MPVTRILHRAGNSRDLLDSPAHLAVDAIEADVWVHDHRILVHHDRPLRPLPISVGTSGIRRIRRDGIRLPELSEAVLANDAELILDLRSYFGDPSPDVVRELLELPDRSHISVTCFSATSRSDSSSVISMNFPALTPSTESKPRVARARAIVSPCGSLTVGLSVTRTVARNIS